MKKISLLLVASICFLAGTPFWIAGVLWELFYEAFRDGRRCMDKFGEWLYSHAKTEGRK